MSKFATRALILASMPLLLGINGCMTKTVNHCVDDPVMVGCPELCLDAPELKHCELVPPEVFFDGGVCGRCTVNLPFCDESTPECIACSVDSECSHLTATPACDEAMGNCVECTVETEATDCPAPMGEDFGPACDPVNLTCTGALRNSLGFCSPCISDSECASPPEMGTYRCVPMLFDGAFHGNYCLLDHESYDVTTGDLDALCPDQQPSLKVETSILGIEASYCTIREGVTTCEAVLDFSEGPCGGDDSSCGAPGLNDAVCRENACTYPCLGDRDCGGGTDSCHVSLRTCNP